MTERLPVLDNPRSERIRGIVALGRRSVRVKTGLLRVEGPQALSELLRWHPETVRDIYFSESAADRYPQLAEGARAATKWCHLMTDQVTKSIAEEAQGVVAVCTADAIGGSLQELSQGTVVVLPQTQDPGNAGTIIRNASAFGAAAIVGAIGTVDLSSPKVIRSSVGTVFQLPIIQGLPFAQVADMLRAAECQLVGTSGSQGSLALGDASLQSFHAWIFGNEAQGLSADEEGACDVLVRIPMTGHAESLNVAVASGVCLYASQQLRGLSD